MGCNTSKESVQPVEGEEKTEDKTEDKVEGVTATPTPDDKETDKEEIKEENDKDKDSNKESLSKPTTLKPLTPPSSRSGERLSNHLAATTPEPPCDEDEDSHSPPGAEGDAADEEQAATRIQAVFRGHQARRTMKQTQQGQQPQQEQEPEPTREQLEAEFRADDVELCKAATTIQNSFRNHLKTKQDGGEKGEGSAAGKEENKEEEELDIDLTDPDLNKAATKIQASFRGHKVRKETEGEEKH